MKRHLLIISLCLISLCLPVLLAAGPGEVAPGKGPELVLHQPKWLASGETTATFYAHSRRPGADYYFEVQHNDKTVEINYDYEVIINVEGVEDIAANFDLSSLELASRDTLTWMLTAVDEANIYTVTESTDIE